MTGQWQAPRLAGRAATYRGDRGSRPPADPIGQRGLPEYRGDLDRLVTSLCDRLNGAGSIGVRGKQLVEELRLRDARALRLLVAYTRVHQHNRNIVGVPGCRYYWAPAVPKLVARMIRDARWRARCYFKIAAVLEGHGVASSMVQLMFDFMGENVPPEKRRADDLAALMAAEGVTPETFLDVLVGRLAETDEGKKALAGVGAKHAAVLLPAETLKRLAGKLDEIKADLLTAGRRAG